METMSLVSFERVSKRFGDLEVLEDFSLEVRADDVVGLLGPSGVGKSTVLKLIAGIERPSGGRLINRTQRVGYVFQEPRLLPWKTTLANVVLPAVSSGLSSREARDRARHYLDKMGLGGFESYFPAQLSGGMLQRVALARAFAVQPDMLLLDEPFSALDLGLKAVLETMLEELLRERPIPVLYVSHSPEEVVRFANRILMMFAGGVVEELPVEEDDAFRAFLEDAFLMTT